jgi:hypothetical protein
VLGTIAACRSRRTCVRQTDDLFKKHGAPLLLVAKFIPGVSAVAIRRRRDGVEYPRFLLFA